MDKKVTAITTIITPQITPYRRQNGVTLPWRIPEMALLQKSLCNGLMVSIPVPCLSRLCLRWRGSRAAAQRGRSPVEHRGTFFRSSVGLSVCLFVCPPPSPSGLPLLWSLFWPKFCQIAQIQAIWPKSEQNGPDPSRMAQIWLKSWYRRPQ